MVKIIPFFNHKKSKIRRACPGFEPGTSRTLSENYTPRPTGRSISTCLRMDLYQKRLYHSCNVHCYKWTAQGLEGDLVRQRQYPKLRRSEFESYNFLISFCLQTA